jgi:hypothetical protein
MLDALPSSNRRPHRLLYFDDIDAQNLGYDEA